MNRNRLVAHRGCPLEFPENSEHGVRRSLELDARYIEIDVQLSRDRQVILHHDRTLDRSCGTPEAVHDLTLQELNRLSFSEPDFFGARYRGLPPASLDRIVRLCRRSRDLTLFIEVKPVSVERFSVETVLAAVKGAVSWPPLREVLICYSPDLLEAARASGWNRTGLILEDWDQVGRPEAEVPQFLFCNISRLPGAGSLAVPGKTLCVYDVIDPGLGERLLRRGADLLETFDFEGMSASDRA